MAKVGRFVGSRIGSCLVGCDEQAASHTVISKMNLCIM
jgi:hypothetical protein